MQVNPTIPAITERQSARFWSKVNILTPDLCWEWTGRRTVANYGSIYVSGRTLAAHRLSFFLTTGIWSQIYICHKCDNPPCCNPNHLFEGTAEVNGQDAVSKGRNNNIHTKGHARGQFHGLAKLTVEQVFEIRSSKETRAKLATRFGVSVTTIRSAQISRTWNHILEIPKANPPTVLPRIRFPFMRYALPLPKRHLLPKHLTSIAWRCVFATIQSVPCRI